MKRKGNGGRWDEECRMEKREVRNKLREWKKVGGDASEYKKRKIRYNRLCEEKKRRKREVGEEGNRGEKRKGYMGVNK